MKLIAISSIYNEQDHIMDMIKSLGLIEDLDAIHILDGAWRRGGEKARSTDNTQKIVFEHQKKHHLEEFIFYTERTHSTLWDSEPAKRNFQLEILKQWYMPQDDIVYALWIDGDEEFITDGNPIKLKPYLSDVKDYYIMESGPKGSQDKFDDPMHQQVRIFRVGTGIHWHTEKPNCFHDNKCNVISDHDYGILPQDGIKLPFEILNKWMARDDARMDEKDVYYHFIHGRKEIPPCLLAYK